MTFSITRRRVHRALCSAQASGTADADARREPPAGFFSLPGSVATLGVLSRKEFSNLVCSLSLLGTGLARTGTNTGRKEFYNPTPSHDTGHGTGAHWHYTGTPEKNSEGPPRYMSPRAIRSLDGAMQRLFMCHPCGGDTISAPLPASNNAWCAIYQSVECVCYRCRVRFERY